MTKKRTIGICKKGLFAALMAGIMIVSGMPAGITAPLDVEAKTEDVNLELSGDLEISMNHDSNDMEQYLTKFRERYPNINLIYTTYEDYETAIVERMREGDYGDVLLVPRTFPYDELPDYLDPIGKVDELSQKYNYVERGYIFDDQVYGITSFAYLYGLIYNKEIFERAGITKIPDNMDEFMEDMKLIRKHTDSIPMYSNYNLTWSLGCWSIFPFFEMNGDLGYKYAEYITEKKPFSEGKPYYEVMKFLYDLIQNGYTEQIPETNYYWREILNKVNTGEIATMVNGSWAVQQAQQNGPTPENIGFMPFPANVDGNQYVTVGTDYCYGIAKNSDNKEAAHALLAYMLDESGYAYGTGNISIVKTDPYPDYINDMSQITMMYETGQPWEAQELWYRLHDHVYPESLDEIYRVMSAAAGTSEESFEDIMQDWNTRWEEGRPQNTNELVEAIENAEGMADTVVAVDNSILSMSELEKSYVEEQSVIKVGYLETAAPFSYEDKEGNFVGLARSVCDTIAEESGLTMEYVGYDRMNEMLKDLEEGTIQLIAATQKMEGKEGLKYTKSYFTVLDVYVVSPNMDITRQEEYIRAVAEDLPVADENLVKKYSDVRECIQAVESEKANYTTTNYYTANYYMEDLTCAVAEMVPASKYSTVHMACREEEDSTLVALINKCMYTMSEESLQVELLKYSTPDDSKITLAKIVRSNPLMSVMIVLIGSIFLIGVISIILIQKNRRNKEHEFAVKKYQMLSSLADEYMFEYDFSKKVFVFDTKFQDVFGFPESTGWDEEDDFVQLQRFLEKLEQYREPSESADEPFELQKDNGESNWFKLMISVMEDDNRNPIYWIGKMVNVQKEMEEMQSYQERAEKDPLTQVYNRRGFYDQLPKTAEKVMFAVIDVDNFKSVNDQLGHAGGDEVLKMLVDQLVKNFGEKALIGRYGGDEFVCVLSNVEFAEADDRMKWMVKCMDTSFQFQGMSHAISISIGAVYSEKMTDTSELFELADQVLYKKKQDGKNGHLIETISR